MLWTMKSWLHCFLLASLMGVTRFTAGEFQRGRQPAQYVNSLLMHSNKMPQFNVNLCIWCSYPCSQPLGDTKLITATSTNLNNAGKAAARNKSCVQPGHPCMLPILMKSNVGVRRHIPGNGPLPLDAQSYR